MLIALPVIKDMNELLRLFFNDNPVCNPMTEINNDDPSLEKVFKVFCAWDIISALSLGIRLFISMPVNIETNKTPAIPSDIRYIRILPRASPTISIRNKRFSGDKNISKKDILLGI